MENLWKIVYIISVVFSAGTEIIIETIVSYKQNSVEDVSIFFFKPSRH